MIKVKVLRENEKIEYEEEIKRLKSSLEIGSIVSFLGVVRSEKGRVKALVYEHYEGMAQSTITQIAQEAVERFGVYGVSIVHKIGQIPAGGDVLLVAVSSRHREEGFKACSWIMDEIKDKAPIWKS
jgi:molybdopterin synthase catalytic subunit